MFKISLNTSLQLVNQVLLQKCLFKLDFNKLSLDEAHVWGIRSRTSSSFGFKGFGCYLMSIARFHASFIARFPLARFGRACTRCKSARQLGYFHFCNKVFFVLQQTSILNDWQEQPCLEKRREFKIISKFCTALVGVNMVRPYRTLTFNFFCFRLKRC